MASVEHESALKVALSPRGPLAEGTIAFVTSTADRLGIGIEVVQVVALMAGTATGTWDVGPLLDHAETEARSAVDATVALLRARTAQPVSGRVVRGAVVTTLAGLAASAELLVMERRDLGRWERFTEGSVTAGVAARAHGNVVCVPADWHPRLRPRPVAVGVEDPARAESEVWTALGLAAAADVPVLLVRAAYLAEPYQELLRREVDQDDLLREAREQLARDAALPASVTEAVPCTYLVRWGRPLDVLIEASDACSLLVVAKRDPRLPIGSHLGPVVRGLLREARCPVLVVEPRLRDGLAPGVRHLIAG